MPWLKIFKVQCLKIIGNFQNLHLILVEVKNMTLNKKIVNETTDNQMEINDIGQTERQTQQRQTMNPYEIDSEQEEW